MNPFKDEELKRQQIEYRIQVAVVKHLDSAFPSLLYTHVPNRSSDAADGFFKKQMGVRPGVADLICWWPSNGHLECGAIELKAHKGRWGGEQNKFASSFTYIGGRYALCKSVKEAHDALCGWGVVPAHYAIVEPDLRGEQQKFADSFDFFKR